jgi:hypothetical protein
MRVIRDAIEAYPAPRVNTLDPFSPEASKHFQLSPQQEAALEASVRDSLGGIIGHPGGGPIDNFKLKEPFLQSQIKLGASKESLATLTQLRLNQLQNEGKKEGVAIDLNQFLLFGDYWVIQKLELENRFTEAKEEADRIIEKRGLVAKAVPWTEADESTYVSAQNLANLIILQSANARVRTSVTDRRNELSFLVTFLDSKPGLKNTIGKFASPDPTDELISRVMDPTWYALDASAPERTEKLAALPHVVGAAESENGFVVILRGKYTYSLQRDEDSVALLSGRQAARAYTSILTSELAANSSTEMQLFSVSKFGKTYEVSIGGSEPLSLTAEEVRQIKEGNPLPRDHEFSKALDALGEASLVLFTNPLTLRDSKQRDAGDEFALALQRSYPSLSVVRDPFSEKTRMQVAKLRGLGTSTAAGVVAVVAEDSFQVKDYKIVQNIEDDLRARGIKIISANKGSMQWKEANGSIVLVITGHIDSHLATFVRELGNAGVLQNNYVLFNSCGAKLSRQLATEMTSLYGATAVFSYESLITPEDLEPLLLQMPGAVEEKSEHPFLELWRTKLREHNLNGIWTVCEEHPLWMAQPA